MMQAPHTIRLEQPDLLAEMPEFAPLGSVILIDDSPTVRAVVDATLRRVGVRITTFSDGLIALGALVRHEVDVPNLVLIDIGLPKMDGYEVARILRSKDEFKNSVLLFLSAHDGPLNKVRARIEGINGFIAKPFRINYLVDEVLRYLERGPVM